MEAYQFNVVGGVGATTIHRYTDAPIDLEQGGHVWQSYPWVRSGFSRIAPEGALTMSAPGLPFTYKSTDSVTLQIYTCRDITVGNPYLTVNEFEPLILAEMKGLEESAHGVTLEFWNGVDETRALATRRFTRACPFVFGDAMCGVDLDSFSHSPQINTVEGEGSWLRSNQWYNMVPNASNWVEDRRLPPGSTGTRPHLGARVGFGSAYSYVIGLATSRPGASPTLNERWIQIHPPLPGISSGDYITVYPNCDKSYSACSAFNNTARFGGWRNIGEWKQ